MLTREQIEEIQGEALLKEKGIPEHQYFWWKRKYARAEVPDGFLPIAGGGLPACRDGSDGGICVSIRGSTCVDKVWLQLASV